MTAFEKLTQNINDKHNFLCVGLDSDIAKMPKCFEQTPEGLLEFNKCIIEQTQDLAIAYKINFAFYEQYGSQGIDVIEKTLDVISATTKCFTIADAKRGDIGNTSAAYAKSVFETLAFDSVTASPYMGLDSLEPFFEYKEKIIFVLALTSNAGSNDFQRLICNDKPVYRYVLEKFASVYGAERLGFVVGATHPQELAGIRQYIPNHPILIPGVGTQGGNLQEVLEANNAQKNNAPALVNVSRAIIYPPNCETKSDFAEAVRNAAKRYII
jgi:orotidine-5'-phosphate decarboxylase